MDAQIYGIPILLLFTTIILAVSTPALPEYLTAKPSAINSNSILVALLDSHYTELTELVEKALLLETLEKAVSVHNITIFAPKNEALQRDLDPHFKRFLLEPRNLRSLQNLLLFHMIPTRIETRHWPDDPARTPTRHVSLCHDETILIDGKNGERTVSSARIVRPDDVTRPDGVIHGIERLLVPRSVQQDFNARRSLSSISAVLPEGAPVVDPRLKKSRVGPSPPAGSPPLLPIADAMAPGPSLAPAPAPGPGGAHRHFDGASQVKDFIRTLLHFGGYNEFADIIVNLTSLASEMGKLVSEGYVLTVLAPNDEAMAKLTTDQLSDPGAPELIVYYHLIPEYQTEESMYNAVRRFGKVNYDTLRLPHKMVATEGDGSVKFGKDENSAYLLEPDIYIDGRISVQGIDNVLFPEVENTTPAKAPQQLPKVVAKPRRGKLLEIACTVLGAVRQDSHFSLCY